MENENKKPSNPRIHNPDGVYASEARNEDCVTLRDYFAAKAMQGWLSNPATTIKTQSKLVSESYAISDAMLKQREI